MKYLGNNQITRTILALLTIGVLSIGLVSLATMSHNNMMVSVNCPVTVSAGDHSQPSESSACVDYHLGIIQKLSNAIPQSFGVQMLGLIFVTLFVLVVFGSLEKIFRYYYRFKVRFRQFLEETLQVFQDQLGFWLAIVQKRDPSYSFIMV